MTKARSLVCGIDETGNARPAARLAGILSEHLALRLVLVHVAAPPVTAAAPVVPHGAMVVPVDEADVVASSQKLVAELAAREGLGRASIRIEVGSAVETLLAVAEEERAEFLVVGSRRRSRVAAAVLGSVSSAVATRAACPVVVVPDEVEEERFRGPVVCGVDDAESAREPVRVAVSLSKRLGARLLLMHVAPKPSVPGAATVPGASERIAEVEAREARAILGEVVRREGLDASVQTHVAFGSPARALTDYVKDKRARLIVVGRSDRSKVESALLGSVSSDVAANAPCPVVVVPPASDQSRRDA